MSKQVKQEAECDCPIRNGHTYHNHYIADKAIKYDLVCLRCEACACDDCWSDPNRPGRGRCRACNWPDLVGAKRIPKYEYGLEKES